MARRSFLAFSLLLGMLALAWPPAATAQAKRLLLFGDSLMAGYGLPRAEAFEGQLAAALAAKGLDVAIVNASVSGDTTAGGAARLGWTLAQPVDAAILCLGANDALRGLDVAAMERNLDAMLTELARRKVPVLLAGMMAPRNLGPEYVAAFDAVFPRLAAKHGVLFLPFLLEGVAADPSLNQADGTHPNAKGVARMVAGVLPLTLKLLGAAS